MSVRDVYRKKRNAPSEATNECNEFIKVRSAGPAYDCAKHDHREPEYILVPLDA
jgi:hypothetical protein